MKSDFIRTDFTYQYPPFNVMATRDADVMMDGVEPMHIYVHLPFCRSKCQYCYYKTWGVGTRAEDEIQSYLEKLYAEIELHARRPEIQRKRARSLYIGGGTPTLLTIGQLKTLVERVKGAFRFVDGFEFCMEANPDEELVTSDKIAAIKDLGVTRLSIGVESLSDQLLKTNGRAGTSEAFRRIYEHCRNIGFESINLDFLSGLVDEQRDHWYAQVAEILDLGPDNVSIYKLEFYLNTRLSQRVQHLDIKGRIMSDAEEAELARYAFEELQQRGGYIPCHCFTLMKNPRYHHVHTAGVWSGESLLGIGLSAYGVIDDVLYQNAWAVEDYAALVRQGRLPVKRAHQISAREKIARTMVYGVKTLHLSRDHFMHKHGFDMTLLYGDVIQDLVGRGLLEFDDEALRVPRHNCIYADDICRYFFLPEHETMMRGHLTREVVATKFTQPAVSV